MDSHDSTTTPDTATEDSATTKVIKGLDDTRTAIWKVDSILQVMQGENEIDGLVTGNLAELMQELIGPACENIDNALILLEKAPEHVAQQPGDLGGRILAALEKWEARCARMSAAECAARLRAFNWDASENIGVPEDAQCEDRFTVQRTWSLKGLRYQLALAEMLEEALSEETDDAPTH